MDCSELLEQLSEFIDREAREDLCREIEKHLQHCHDCSIQVDRTRKVILLYQADRRIDIPVAVSDKLRIALAREYGGPQRSD